MPIKTLPETGEIDTRLLFAFNRTCEKCGFEFIFRPKKDTCCPRCKSAETKEKSN